MLLGRYRLGRELGRGAYGVVNVAGDFRDGRRSVAIKSLDLSVLPRSETAWTADAIEQEVALMRRLDHPNVVRVFDLVRASGSNRLFIIMELCRGNLPHHRTPASPRGTISLKHCTAAFVSKLSHSHQAPTCSSCSPSGARLSSARLRPCCASVSTRCSTSTHVASCTATSSRLTSASPRRSPTCSARACARSR